MAFDLSRRLHRLEAAQAARRIGAPLFVIASTAPALEAALVRARSAQPHRPLFGIETGVPRAFEMEAVNG